MYAEGSEGLPQDKVKAAELFRRACDGGERFGCAVLGLMHLEGDGVPQDPGEARQLFQTACEAGFAEACKWSQIPTTSGELSLNGTSDADTASPDSMGVSPLEAP
jgi:TPR repeat protein